VHERAAREVSARVFSPERFTRGPVEEGATVREKRPRKKRR
jgi:hypothetical protein